MKTKTKYILFSVFCVLLYSVSFSFNIQSSDSISQALNGGRFLEPSKIDSVNSMAENLMDENHERSLSLAHEALELAKRINYKHGIYRSNYILGRLHTNYTLNFIKAIQYFTEAEKFSDKTDWKQQLDLLEQIAYLHKRQENSDKAIEYYELAIQLAESNKAEKKASSLNGYLSEVYEANGDTTQALQCLHKIVEIEKSTGYEGTEPAAFLSIAHYYELQKQYAVAEAFLLDAMRVFEREKNHRWASYTDYLLAKLSMQRNAYRAAISYANSGLELAQKYGLKKEIADNHAVLAELYDSVHDYKNAYRHLSMLKAMEDSVFSAQRTKQMASAMADYETVIKEEQLKKLEAERRLDEAELTRTRVIGVAVFVLMILGVSLALVFYRNYRIKQRINKELWNRIELRKLNLDEIIKQLNAEIESHLATKAKLEVANIELNNFMYKSSHDIKSPLASIMGLAHIAKGNINDKERLEYLFMIERSTSRLSAFVDELGQATKVTHGNVDIMPVNVYVFCTEMIDDLRNSENFKGVRIIVRIGKELEVNTDKTLLKTILYNLIENGAKYKNPIQSDPFVSISAERMGNALMIGVSDNGLGIAPEHQPKIFDMFYRANNATQGSGLGLYLVEKSVLKLGGTIRLRSQQGEGTEVEISIPDVVRRPAKEVLLS